MKKISFLLVALLLTLSAGAQTNNCDVNGDGDINVADVAAVVKAILSDGNSTPVVPEEPATDSRAIDLGLPSGLKWASCNVGATAPEEYGGYYAWGGTEEKSSYYKSDYLYYNSNGSYTNIGSDISGTEYDVAHVQWGGSWRMPTLDEIKELYYCTWEWTTLNGVNGYRVTGPNGNSIFLPAAGYRNGEEVRNQGSLGYYWSSTLYSNSYYAYFFHFSSSGYYSSYDDRCRGLTVRPVCGTPIDYYTVNVTCETGGRALTSNGGTSITIAANNNVTITATADTGYTFAGWYNGETLVSTETTYTFIPSENITLTAKFTAPAITRGEAIDLGLPSGLKWASCNVGATEPWEYGGYYAWGETEEKSDYDWDTYKYCNGTNHSMTKYCISSSRGTVDNKTTLEPGDDVAHVKWGGSWRMPTTAELYELYDNCTMEWTTLNGVNGYRVTGPNGNSIFLPTAGCRYYEEVGNQGSYGYYWSSSLDSYSGGSAALTKVFYSSGFYFGQILNRYYGFTVRPVSE